TRFSLGSFLLFVLFIAHALVGAVELGTDGWIQNITGNLFTSEQGKYLFIWTSAIMFGLRFCAHFIETKLRLSPIGLLLVCSVLACIGLQLASTMQTFSMALAALGIYAIGKTFFWPTMLGFVSENIPESGALGLSVISGAGMLSTSIFLPISGVFSDNGATGQEILRYTAVLPAILIVIFAIVFITMRRKKA
ncbi:MAG: MFS transporter, partial [Bacteroidia bacterium]|nr:MFS transporter [Bacteroidia bacterium]